MTNFEKHNLAEELFRSAEAIDRAYDHAEQIEIQLAFQLNDGPNEKFLLKTAGKLTAALGSLSIEYRTVADLYQKAGSSKLKSENTEYYGTVLSKRYKNNFRNHGG